MFNLFNQISEEDKIKINNYIRLYGAASHTLPLEEWLANWSVCKIKLYKLLGNNLIVKIPYSIDKPNSEKDAQMRTLIVDNHDFIEKYRAVILLACSKYSLNEDIKYDLLHPISLGVVESGATFHPIKIKIEEKRKQLQIQAGSKVMKAIRKILEYFSEDIDNDEYVTLVTMFEKFRIKHSIITDEKKLSGNLVLSIHPLDFMTMSDTNSWSSCMNWTRDGDGGCYHVGTIETMNSNNVICCYFESNAKFYFGEKKNLLNLKYEKLSQPEEDYTWNHKYWRQLFYVTKDIIVSGKSYPYAFDQMTKDILTHLRELAKENLNWTYSFGIEEYRDMIHINGSYSMNRARNYINAGNAWKKNILFDTKGMYNDMLNDSETTYWCVRNKVKHTKIISYSGKANCLCCGGSIISESDYTAYNDRFDNTGRAVCETCIDDFFRCDCCNSAKINDKLIQLYDKDKDKTLRLCHNCVIEEYRICPCCGEPLNINTWKNSANMMFYVKKDYRDDFGIYSIQHRNDIEQDWFSYKIVESDPYFNNYNRAKIYTTNSSNKDVVVPVFMHEECLINHFKHHKWGTHDKIRPWGGYRTYNYYLILEDMDYEKFMVDNLPVIDLEKAESEHIIVPLEKN